MVRDVLARWRTNDWHIETVIALAVAVVSAAGAWVDDPSDTGQFGWWPAMVATSAGLVLIARRVLPLAVLGMVLVLLAAVEVQNHQTGTTVVSLLFASHAAGRWAPGRRAVVGLVAIWLMFAALALEEVGYFTRPIAMLAPVIYSLPWLLGRYLAAREVVVERDREAARIAERSRVARELHDIVTHALTGISVQASSARYLGSGGVEATEAFGRIEHMSRQALGDLRRMLDLLREDTGTPVGPTPGIENLAELVGVHSAIHGPVELHVDPALGEVGQSAGLVVYRVVQEALTNVARHAQGARSVVCVRRAGRRLVVTVEDTGAGVPAPLPSSYGLIGMRERLSVFGGRLDAGPRADGGFVVRAEIPGSP